MDNVNSSDSGIHKGKWIAPAGGTDVAAEVQDLVWALVDDYIEEPQLRRLESLITENVQARTTYIQCIQLHVDLIYYFAAQRQKKDPNAPGPFPLPAELQAILRSESGRSDDSGDRPASYKALLKDDRDRWSYRWQRLGRRFQQFKTRLSRETALLWERI